MKTVIGRKTRTGIMAICSRQTNKTKIVVEIRLDDDLNNGHADFSMCCNGWEKAKNGTWVESFGGADHKSILKFFPDFADFAKLHLCDCHGVPMYALENGLYILREKGPEACSDYLRISLDEAKMLQNTDKMYAAYLLVKNGIYQRWQAEADAAIKHLEELTGLEFVNQHKDDERPQFQPLTEEEKAEVEKRINEHYYTPDAIQARADDEARRKREKERQEIVDRYDKDVEKALRDKQVMLYVFDRLGTVSNVIYYDHSNTLAFNWENPQYASHVRHWKQEEFVDFVNSVDYSKLPEGIKFDLKYQYAQ